MESPSPQTEQDKWDSTPEPLVLPFTKVDHTSLPLVGGKGANLGEMIRAGLPVPPGFCVTTIAYDRVATGAALEPVLIALEGAAGPSPDCLAALAVQARVAVRAAPVPAEVQDAVRSAYATLCAGGEPVPVAVRSSATAEDLPDASFAGQHDTYLNVIGPDAVLDAVRRCWASLWTDRAVAYRTTNGIDHRTVKLAVVVQLLVPSAVSGVLFTANPLTNRRQEAVIEATPGLGEALVSGLVNPDHFVVDLRTLAITERKVTTKQMTIRPRAGGGTEPVPLSGAADSGERACIGDSQVLEIARLGARVEAHYHTPQDIEWALDVQGCPWLLQARPITTLFPPLEATPTDPDSFRVYFSFSLAQGVLQPLTPMGLDLLRRVGVAVASLAGFPADPGRGPAAMAVAGGRLYIELTPLLKSPWGRHAVSTVSGNMEPRTGEAVRGLFSDPRLAPTAAPSKWRVARHLFHVAHRTKMPFRVARAFLQPARARRAAEARVRSFLAESARSTGSPGEALDRAAWLAGQIPSRVGVQLIPLALAAGMGSFVMARRLAVAIGAGDEAQRVLRGLPHNVTTEMNLELWSISRRLRAEEGVAKLLAETPLQALAARYLAGALPAVVQREIAHFLGKYGFRGVAEIDVGIARWEDDPAYIFGVLGNYLRLADLDLAPDVQFRRATAEAEAALERVIAGARRSGPLGLVRAAFLRMLFRRVRELLGMREAPKFYAVAVIGRCRQLLQEVGAALLQAGRLDRAEDVFFLTFAEARAALAGDDPRVQVRERRAEYAREWKRRRIPRLLLSDGTAFYGELAVPEGVGAGTLAGTPASPGVYTGVARVIMDPAGARLDPGDVLVAPSTDPGWTPLFMTAGALVMEMGGMMSHGSVVAREYGIPAVVGVVGATMAIHTGQQITVDGERGIVLIVNAEPH